jgi:hypothetical protein
MITRTSRHVMTEMATHRIPTTQDRASRAFCSGGFDPIRHKPVVQTTAEDLLRILHANGNSVAHYLRRLHNLPLISAGCHGRSSRNAHAENPKRAQRAITAAEQEAVIASEKNAERKAYYEVL